MLKTGLRCDFYMFYIYKRCRFACPENCKNGFSFSPFTQFWAYNEASDPHFSALDTPKLHLCTLVPMPGNPVSHTPNRPLGYPKWPNGVCFTTHHVVIVMVVLPLSNVCFYLRTA